MSHAYKTNLVLLVIATRSNDPSYRGSVDIVRKLGDFGISTAGTSKRLIVTKDARGSGSYYAPEILLSDAETPSYTNKVDIWGLEDSREIPLQELLVKWS